MTPPKTELIIVHVPSGLREKMRNYKNINWPRLATMVFQNAIDFTAFELNNTVLLNDYRGQECIKAWDGRC